MDAKIRELRKRESIALEHYQDGLSLHELDPKGAEACYNKVIEVAPEHVGAMCGLVSIYVDEKRVDEAREMLVAVVRLCPGHEFALLELAKLFASSKKPRDLTCAAALYARALVSNLNSAIAMAGLTASMNQLRRREQGHGAAISEVGLDPEQMKGLLHEIVERFGREDDRSEPCLELRNLLARPPQNPSRKDGSTNRPTQAVLRVRGHYPDVDLPASA